MNKKLALFLALMITGSGQVAQAKKLFNLVESDSDSDLSSFEDPYANQNQGSTSKLDYDKIARNSKMAHSVCDTALDAIRVTKALQSKDEKVIKKYAIASMVSKGLGGLIEVFTQWKTRKPELTNSLKLGLGAFNAINMYRNADKIAQANRKMSADDRKKLGQTLLALYIVRSGTAPLELQETVARAKNKYKEDNGEGNILGKSAGKLISKTIKFSPEILEAWIYQYFYNFKSYKTTE